MARKNWKIITLIVTILVASTAVLVEYRRIYILKDRLSCVTSWLDEAKSLHAVQMKEAANFSGDSMKKLMDSVDQAYACAASEPSYSRIAPGGGAFGEHGAMPPHQ